MAKEIRSVGETNLEESRVETNLDLNREEGRILDVTITGKNKGT